MADKVRRDAEQAAAGLADAGDRVDGAARVPGVEVAFAGRALRSNHWVVDPRTDLP